MVSIGRQIHPVSIDDPILAYIRRPKRPNPVDRRHVVPSWLYNYTDTHGLADFRDRGPPPVTRSKAVDL